MSAWFDYASSINDLIYSTASMHPDKMDEIHSIGNKVQDAIWEYNKHVDFGHFYGERRISTKEEKETYEYWLQFLRRYFDALGA